MKRNYIRLNVSLSHSEKEHYFNCTFCDGDLISLTHLEIIIVYVCDAKIEIVAMKKQFYFENKKEEKKYANNII